MRKENHFSLLKKAADRRTNTMILKKFIILTVCFFTGILSLTGCSDNSSDFQNKNYTADEAQIQSVSIDVRDRQIQVSLSADDLIHIDYYESDKEYYDISLSSDNVLTMKAASDKEWSDYIGGKASGENRTISLQIPDSLLSSLVLSTTNENISLPSVTVTGSISLTANSGNITFEKLNPGKSLTLKAKNGNIDGTIMGSYDDYRIISEIKKGENNLPSNKTGGSKSLNVSNNNGDIKIEFTSE